MYDKIKFVVSILDQIKLDSFLYVVPSSIANRGGKVEECIRRNDKTYYKCLLGNIGVKVFDNRLYINGSLANWLGDGYGCLSLAQMVEGVSLLAQALGIEERALYQAKIREVEIFVDIPLISYISSMVLEQVESVEGYVLGLMKNGSKYFIGAKTKEPRIEKATRVLSFYDKATQLKKCQGIECDCELLRVELRLSSQALRDKKLSTFGTLISPDVWEYLRTYFLKQIQGLKLHKTSNTYERPRNARDWGLYGRFIYLESRGGIAQVRKELEKEKGKGITERKYKEELRQFRNAEKIYQKKRPAEPLEEYIKQQAVQRLAHAY